MRLVSAIKQEVLFQFRHGFYYIYLFLSVVYIVILKLLPEDIKAIVLPILIFSDPAVAGFFFLGAMILLERGQRTLEGLFVTPLTVIEYFLTKIIAFVILSLVTCLFIILIVSGINVNFLPVVLGIFLGSVLFTLLGFPFAASAKSVNHYFIIAGFFFSVFSIPVLDFLKIVPSPVFSFFPTMAVIRLVHAGFYPYPLIDLLLALGVLLFWIILAFLWAYHWFYKYIIYNAGGDKCSIKIG